MSIIKWSGAVGRGGVAVCLPLWCCTQAACSAGLLGKAVMLSVTGDGLRAPCAAWVGVRSAAGMY